MYTAIVGRIHTRPLEGSDNIQIGNILGYTVIVGKDTRDGELVLFFEAGGQLSSEYADKNNLVSRKDDQGNRIGGFFAENRKVSHLKLRGVLSEGYVAPLNSVGYTGVDITKILVEGYEFDALNSHPISNRYETEATKRASANRQVVRRPGEMKGFLKQPDIPQLRHVINTIPDDGVLYFTAKHHGTSGRLSRVLVEKPSTVWWRKLAEKYLHFPLKREYVYLNGSKNVILEGRSDSSKDFYGTDAFRFNATKNIILRKGETLYFELTGWVEKGKPIMSPQDTTSLKDKKVSARFGPKITYSYGQEEGTCGLWVYRITMTDEDGRQTDLSWQQVKERCQQLGLRHVPELGSIILNAEVKNTLLERVDLLVNGIDGIVPSKVDSRHLEEGIVIRCESTGGTLWIKQKSTLFYFLEGVVKDDPTVIDMEESS